MLSQYKNIQVSVDGSKEADLAFSKAVSIAKRNHATLQRTLPRGKTRKITSR